MTEVYIVTSGQYSDYGITAVFSTEEKAQEFCDKVNGKVGGGHGFDESRVEPHVLDELNADRRPWDVWMDYATGNAAEADGYNSWDIEDLEKPGKPSLSEAGKDWKGVWRGAQFRVTVIASSKEQAIKGANERRTQYRAIKSENAERS